MARLIDADKLYDILEDYYKRNGALAHVMIRKALDEICDAQSIDAAPVVHGYWITFDDCGELECSICGGIQIERGDFCTHCGAKMDEGGEDKHEQDD